jgi:hypothetical protein
MPISFACPCGRQIRVKDGSAGRVLSCPACKSRLQVPAPDAVELVDLGIKEPADDPDFAGPYPVAGPAKAVPLPARRASQASPNDTNRVKVVDFDIPFGSMVGFLVKFEFASLLAAILVAAIVLVPIGLLLLIGRLISR